MIHNDKRKKPPRSPSVEDWILKCSVYTPGASQVALVVKKVPASAGDIRDAGSVPGSGRSPGGGQGDPLQYSYLEVPMDRKPGRLQSIGSQRVRHD